MKTIKAPVVATLVMLFAGSISGCSSSDGCGSGEYYHWDQDRCVPDDYVWTVDLYPSDASGQSRRRP
ncbi:MAG: hypothetical protein ACR2PJ_00620 [Pseudomonadales bacterium]